jgi:hypothetical protein
MTYDPQLSLTIERIDDAIEALGQAVLEIQRTLESKHIHFELSADERELLFEELAIFTNQTPRSAPQPVDIESTVPTRGVSAFTDIEPEVTGGETSLDRTWK